MFISPYLGCHKIKQAYTQWAMTYFSDVSLPGGHVGCVSLDRPGLHPTAL